MQRSHGNLNLPSAFDEVQHVRAVRLRMGQEKLCDRPGIAGQEFSIGTTGEAMLYFPHHISGRELALTPNCSGCDLEEPRHLSLFQPHLTMQ